MTEKKRRVFKVRARVTRRFRNGAATAGRRAIPRSLHNVTDLPRAPLRRRQQQQRQDLISGRGMSCAHVKPSARREENPRLYIAAAKKEPSVRATLTPRRPVPASIILVVPREYS